MLVIGIAGGTGSGKTTVVNKIINSFPAGEVAVLQQDAYYKDLSFMAPELRAGNAIEMPTYSYITCTRQEETIRIEPRDVIIIEGILVLTEAELRQKMDVKVFVDADPDDRLIRVIARDCIERGRTPKMVIDRYQAVLKPMHLQYIEPAKRYADLIIPQGGSNTVAIGLLTDYIESRLKKAKQ